LPFWVTTWISTGPVSIVADVLQDRQQVLEIVAVDRADMIEAELLEQRAAGDIAARIFSTALVIGAIGDRLPDRRSAAWPKSRSDIGLARGHARQIGAHGAGPAARSTCRCR
jgi:hypothetical protein